MVSAFAGLLYFIYITTRIRRRLNHPEERVRPQIKALRILGRPAIYTFAESMIRNSIYLWIVSRIIALGQDYATAWGVFNTIRWGLIMVPVQALEASTLTFVGHNWGRFRAQVGVANKRPRASLKDLKSPFCALRTCWHAWTLMIPH
jgi:Na+-driven multidrug efflux pump